MAKRCTAPELADRLRGTAVSMPEWAYEASKAFHAQLDDLIFECARCNWWHDVSALTNDDVGEQVCVECKTGGEDNV